MLSSYCPKDTRHKVKCKEGENTTGKLGPMYLLKLLHWLCGDLCYLQIISIIHVQNSVTLPIAGKYISNFLSAWILSCVQLFATPWTGAHQAPLSLGFSRQEHWSGLLFPPPGDLPNPEIKSDSFASPALVDEYYTPSMIWEALTQLDNYWVTVVAAAAKSLQSFPTLCDPIDGSPPDSSVPGILQAKTLECVAISFSHRVTREFYFFFKSKQWDHHECMSSLWAQREAMRKSQAHY